MTVSGEAPLEEVLQSPEDYVASPTNPGTVAGAAVSYRNPSDFTG